MAGRGLQTQRTLSLQLVEVGCGRQSCRKGERECAGKPQKKKTRVGKERLMEKEKGSRFTANGFVLIVFLAPIRVVIVLRWIR